MASTTEIQRLLTYVMRGERALYEDELEFDQDGHALVDPRKLPGDKETLARIQHGRLPDGGDVLCRRPVKMADRSTAAVALAKMRGMFIENIHLKAEGALGELLKSLRGELKPRGVRPGTQALAKKREA